MGSRSSRLFIVLVHLVGVTTNVPRNRLYFWNVGIVGVQTVDVLMETLELGESDGLNSFIESLPQEYQDAILSHPYWLLDESDGQCLGPEGFSECGDATLWMIKTRSTASEKNAVASFFANILPGQIYEKNQRSEQDGGYALELLDFDRNPMSSVVSSLHSKSDEKYTGFGQRMEEERESNGGDNQGECLLPEKNVDRRRRNHHSESKLRVGRCSDKAAWRWYINSDGVLSHRLHTSNHAPKKGKEPIEVLKSSSFQSLCVWRQTSSAYITEFCDPTPNNTSANQDVLHDNTVTGKGVVKFSLVRYQTSPHLHRVISPPRDSLESSAEIFEEEVKQLDVTPEVGYHTALGLNDLKGVNDKVTVPHTKTNSEISVHQAQSHPELKPLSSLSHNQFSPDTAASFLSFGENYPSHKSSSQMNIGKVNRQQHLSKIDFKGSSNQQSKSQILHYHASSPAQEEKIHLFKIPSNPYIEASKNFVWKDRDSGLEYPTDLCGYLGQEKKRSGRHTLVGVGQYARTVFNIKVYGIALYVSKRDVLADPEFVKFASLTAGQLRERDDFYEHLMKQPIDRTLFFKTNMQLSTETMRGSLAADWKLLTEEHKNMLISSSFRPRAAETRMLDKIKSSDNPSKCSCGQTAPKETMADRSCCAAGTELVFTWRKNGNFEVRIDGRIMDTFTDPTVATGIFYEYLRNDDPICPAAHDRFADGFPFLLAPLSHVKGLSVGHLKEKLSPNAEHQPPPQPWYDLKIITDLTGSLGNKGSAFIEWARYSVDDVIQNVLQAPKKVEQYGDILNKRRVSTIGAIVEVSGKSVKYISRKVPFFRSYRRRRNYSDNFPLEIPDEEGNGLNNIEAEQVINDQLCDMSKGKFMCSKASGAWNYYLRSLHMFDNMDGKNVFFRYMVHLYLILLLIVSLPGCPNTKTVYIHSPRHNEKDIEKENDCNRTKSISRNIDINNMKLSLQLTLGNDSSRKRDTVKRQIAIREHILYCRAREIGLQSIPEISEIEYEEESSSIEKLGMKKSLSFFI